MQVSVNTSSIVVSLLLLQVGPLFLVIVYQFFYLYVRCGRNVGFVMQPYAEQVIFLLQVFWRITDVRFNGV